MSVVGILHPRFAEQADIRGSVLEVPMSCIKLKRKRVMSSVFVAKKWLMLIIRNTPVPCYWESPLVSRYAPSHLLNLIKSCVALSILGV